MKRILLLTVLPHLHEDNIMQLEVFLDSVQFLQRHFEVKVHALVNRLYIDPVPTNLVLVQDHFRRVPHQLFFPKRDYPDMGVGMNHTVALHQLITDSTEALPQYDFILILDFDCYFIPERIEEFKEFLGFWERKRFVYGNVSGKYEFRGEGGGIKEFEEHMTMMDFNYPIWWFTLPRITPFFYLMPSELFNDFRLTRKFNFHNIHRWKFGGTHAPKLDGDSGFLMFNHVPVITDVYWIFQPMQSLPVHHFGGLTSNWLKDKDKCVRRLEGVKRFYEGL